MLFTRVLFVLVGMLINRFFAFGSTSDFFIYNVDLETDLWQIASVFDYDPILNKDIKRKDVYDKMTSTTYRLKVCSHRVKSQRGSKCCRAFSLICFDCSLIFFAFASTFAWCE